MDNMTYGTVIIKKEENTYSMIIIKEKDKQKAFSKIPIKEKEIPTETIYKSIKKELDIEIEFIPGFVYKNEKEIIFLSKITKNKKINLDNYKWINLEDAKEELSDKKDRDIVKEIKLFLENI